MYGIALTIALYQTTGSISSVAFMWLIRAAMRIPIQFISGIVADSFPRKKLVCFTNFISMPIALGFLLIDKQNWIFIYTLIFLLQALNDIEYPAILGLTQELVNKEQLKDANATSELLNQIATFSAPAIAGGLMWLWDVSVLFLVNGISFLLAGLILLTIRYTSVIKEKKKQEFTLFRFAKEGYQKVIENKVLFLIICIGVLPGMVGRFYEIYKVYVSDQLLNLGAEGIILFSYAMAIGGIISPILIKLFLKSKKITAHFYIMIVLSVSGIMAIWGLVSNPILSFILLTIAAILFSVLGIILNTYLQENVEKEYIGRIFSLYRMLMIMGAIVGILLAPPLLELWNASLGFLIVFGIALVAFLGLKVFHDMPNAIE